MSGSFLLQAIVFLAGAVICVPLAKKLGLSSVIGYLFGGMLIGPYILGFVGHEGEDIMEFAEFGVVMMLFLIGLEIEPRSFWKMRKTILGLGMSQVFGTILLTYLVCYAFGLDWNIALTIAMAVALSSTAITLQTNKEKGLMNTIYGASSFSILLFQDIIVIVMLGVLPLLSNVSATLPEEGTGTTHVNLLNNLPLPLQAVGIFTSIVLIVLAGRYVIVPVLRLVARSGVRELLVASALLIVVAISYLMELVGLSPALGAFLGGVVLATSEFKHELESTLDPIKGLLLGLFFMAVGASINFIVIGEQPLLITSLVLGVIALKAFVLFVVGWIFKLKIDQRLLLTVGLAQIGEFAFVVLSFAFQLNIFTREQLDILLVVTALTMTLTPIIWILNERLVLPRVGTKESEKRPMDQIEKQHKVLLLGFGHFGSTVGRFLRAHGVQTTVIDSNSNRVDYLRKMGFEVYYGDVSRIDLLESAGIADADFLISAIDDPDVNLSLMRKLKEKYPKLKLMVRAKNRYDAYEFFNMGIENIYRESFETSVRLASDVLYFMGFDQTATEEQAQKFIRLDNESFSRLAASANNRKDYIFKARQEIALQERLLDEDLNLGSSDLAKHKN
ncbi:potassium transporter [Subsaximicrobium wynnwilliamsii]|uniref:Potassium transporter n=1 Tax=Subsaximicrobium wynnwilliamsii TaxID=291179 RepID=A0A5C6ZMC2_9FLAO|nr:monovalent cation:proton antiporter-2 (CPA2) family protein [Subsaximicrobium wynnwilliamsii]TXD84402.1 potassium transporter [Subsaximicrobium wynnwilliamsii]TXD90083.1 potassium transporter [Subsaximicrobium wynnwilliamsii]TXE04135.1 potassium transporter [Subsaximicrobium wynnwilliamsii]